MKVSLLLFVWLTLPAVANGIGAIQNVGGTSITLTSDRFGQLTGKGSSAYGWNLAHQITSMGSNTYRYDGSGRRVWNVTGGQWQVDFYSLDGQLVFSQHQSKGNTAYLQLGGKTIAEQNSLSGTSYLHTDHLGSPVAKTNAAKSITNWYRWEPYGASLDGIPSGIGYAGHQSDATGLVYMQQRFMDPGMGRFLSPDPVATDTTNGALFNRYYYANNNPYTHRDPDGRQICSGGFSSCHEEWQQQDRRGIQLFQSGGTQAGPNPVEEFMTMGFGFQAEQEFNSGNYLGWLGYSAAAGAAGWANVMSFGAAKGQCCEL